MRCFQVEKQKGEIEKLTSQLEAKAKIAEHYSAKLEQAKKVADFITNWPSTRLF